MTVLPPGETGHAPDAFVTEARSLLSILKSARDHIARELVREYPMVTDDDLNSYVHESVFAAIFLAAGERCGFVPAGTLRLLADSDGIGRRVERACSDAGLSAEFFGQGKRRAVPALQVPDGPVRELLRNAAGQDFPAPASVVSLEDCAVIFEHYLATRLSVGEGYRMAKTAKSAVLYTGSVHVPEKPVVEYLVRTTLRECLHNLPQDGRGQVRILDPACGAGIFLLAAYRFLAQEEPGRAGILSQSLSATDIDAESVNAARLVLLLASVSEHTKDASAPPWPAQIRAVSESLVRSIRCGNALIAPDFFIGRQEPPFNADERRRVNVFSWQDAFPEAVAAGGFDAIIGAPPPYTPFAVKNREEYFQTHYDSYAPGAGLYGYFTERAFSLLKPGGRLSFLVPATFLRSDSARPLRRLLLTRQLLRIIDTGRCRVLQDRGVMMCILSVLNQPVKEPFAIERLNAGRSGKGAGPTAGRGFFLDQRLLDDGGWILADRRAEGILGRLMARGTPLDHYVMGEIARGPVQGRPKIVIPEYCGILAFQYDRDGSRAPDEPHIVIERDDLYLAGILNSTLARFLFAHLCPLSDRGYHLTPYCIGKFPVITPDFDQRSDRIRHDRIAALFNQNLALYEYFKRTKTGQERRLVQQEIDVIDVMIDALVYELYGLPEEDIAVVEGSSGRI